MTTLGSLLTLGGRANGKTSSQPLDVPRLAQSVVASLIAAGQQVPFPPPGISLLSAMEAWTNQDDDAHDTCDALVACRNPLHPGPCKGWKHTLHSVSPGAWHQLEGERVRKANARRVKRINDLKAQGKPIPRHLLQEIKPKPAPGHPAHAATPVPLHQVNQKADLAGGQAHKAGQSVSQAAGVQVKTPPPLPLGPKGKKPSVAGRGPAFVITQPKVTDTYKLDKAAKITPQEWDSLSDADKKTIRDELAAIKQRGFGPQQKKADELLAKLPAPGTKPTQTFRPAGTVTTPSGKVVPVLNPVNGPSSTPGKVSLGQASKSTGLPGLPATPPTAPKAKPAGPDVVDQVKKAQDPGSQLSPSARVFIYRKLDKADYQRLDDAGKKKLADDLDAIDAGQSQTAKQAAADIRQKLGITKGAAPSPSTVPAAPSTPASPSSPSAPSIASRVTPLAAQGLIKKHGAVDITYGKGTRAEKTFHDVGVGPGHQHQLITKGAGQWYITDKDGKELQFLPKQSGILVSLPNKPSAAPAPTATPGGIKPAVPNAPGTAAHIQHARAVANRTAPKAQMAKTHLDAYAKLSKADFDALPDGEKKQIRDDLADARAKFLDPKKQQAARDLLDRFGSSHAPAVAPGNTSAAAKGYSDPMNEAVKAARGGGKPDDVLKAVARLSPEQAGKLDDDDKKAITSRLAFIATHPQASKEQKEKAASYGRILVGTTKPTGKLDHTVSVGEIHAEATKTGIANATGPHPAVAAALKAADDPKMPLDDRVKALTGITKAQYDSLTPDEKRKIVDALIEVHAARPADKAAEKAVVDFTGHHPGVQRLKQAEADYRAGKIDATGLRREWLSARVQAPIVTGVKDDPHAQVVREAQRIAEDNPSLPLHQRAYMVEADYRAGKHNGIYDAIQQASGEHNFQPAPRLSQFDMERLFQPSSDDLKNAHPIHAEAVKALRLHTISTGLDPKSPWSHTTREALVRALLGIDSGKPVVPDGRLKEFRDLPDHERDLVQKVLSNRIALLANDHAKTETYITLRQLEGAPNKPEVDAALKAAADRFGTSALDLDAYRRLDPDDYQDLPPFVQNAISARLDEMQKRAELGGPTHVWGPGDNAFKVMPASLEAHLNGDRRTYTNRSQRNAADIANYGTQIVTPDARVQAYTALTGTQFDQLDMSSKLKIEQDLDRIARDSTVPLGTRYKAQYARDIGHRTPNNPSPLNHEQHEAVTHTAPFPGARYSDADVRQALSKLDKADYDDLPTPFREAIDARVSTMPGPDQQLFTAKFHPSMATNNPSGMVPTVQANVPPHVQDVLDTLYGVHLKSHTMAHQLKTYGALRGGDFHQHLNPQEQQHLLADLSFIATTAKGPSADKAKKLIDRFTPAGTPLGSQPPGAIIPPANAVPGQQRYATPLKGALVKARDSGKSGDKWIYPPGHNRVWGEYGAAGLLIKHVDPHTGEERYLMVQRGPAISDPGKWTFPGGAIDSKETPHQGAARETLEELGLKDDQLKDAVIHGDHTYSIPGHSWKYTTVAAQIDKQFTPNLSTAHARAETSDAKWMTLDEIRALDAQGKLHGPIAGGKLEQNVISLYPQGGPAGTTLGQIARPGPITRRQGRLAVPSGGRQAPANFNAWPYAHKQSKGKNLVGDKAARDQLRQDIKQERKAYDGKTADGRLAAIGARQGFDDTPTVVSKAEMDRLLATGDYIEAWRGVKGTYGGLSAAQIHEQMRSGPAWYGRGIFGNGYYLATQRRVAQQYSDHSKNSVMRILIPKSAVIEKYKGIQKEARANSSRYSQAKGAKHEEGTLYDAGRWAAAKGVDGIQIDHDTTNDTGGWARHIAAPGLPGFNWLNRSVLIIQEADK